MESETYSHCRYHPFSAKPDVLTLTLHFFKIFQQKFAEFLKSFPIENLEASSWALRAILYFLFQLWFLVLNLPPSLFLATLPLHSSPFPPLASLSSSYFIVKLNLQTRQRLWWQNINNFVFTSLSICAEIYLVVIDQRREKYNTFLYSFSLSVRLFYSIVHFTLYIFLILLALPQDPNHRNSKAAVFGTEKPSVSLLGHHPYIPRDGQAVLISLPLNLVHHLHRLRSTGHTSACSFCNM